jgi:hypothetical protein
MVPYFTVYDILTFLILVRVTDQACSVRNFAVGHDTLVRANRTKAAVRWPGTQTYQAGLETFHQLHCLVSLC